MDLQNILEHLPDSPGVYLMKNARDSIIYIGKAGNLKRRVSSYFQKAHDLRIQKMVSEIRNIELRETQNAIEALMLEAKLIKEIRPLYNIREKDDKSFLFVEITREQFSRVSLVRGKEKVGGIRFGPFTSASSIREALRILRKIFPWSIHGERDTDIRMRANNTNKKSGCFDYQLGLCPGTCIGAISQKDYGRTIAHLKLFFEGKTKRLFTSLKKEMDSASKKLDFERAAKIRKQLFALQHLRDVAVLSNDLPRTSNLAPQTSFRIEGYDISNTSGLSATGSLVVFVDGESVRSEYRKFGINRFEGPNDVGMLREVLERRLKHHEWLLPDLILVDGGAPQVRVVKKVVAEAGLSIPVIGIAKGPERKRNDIIGLIPRGTTKEILIRVRDEAHRFAVRYHRALRAARFYN